MCVWVRMNRRRQKYNDNTGEVIPCYLQTLILMFDRQNTEIRGCHREHQTTCALLWTVSASSIAQITPLPVACPVPVPLAHPDSHPVGCRSKPDKSKQVEIRNKAINNALRSTSDDIPSVRH